jgi:hypothetical protein
LAELKAKEGVLEERAEVMPASNAAKEMLTGLCTSAHIAAPCMLWQVEALLVQLDAVEVQERETQAMINETRLVGVQSFTDLGGAIAAEPRLHLCVCCADVCSDGSCIPVLRGLLCHCFP